MISIKLFEICMQMINFLLLLFIMKKFILVPLMDFLEKRANSIKSDIESAQNQKTESEELLAQRKQLLNQARKEAKDIKDNASVSIVKEKETIISRANTEATQIIDQAKKDVSSMVNQAKQELTSQIGVLSVTLSEKIIRKNIDESVQRDIAAETVQKLS